MLTLHQTFRHAPSTVHRPPQVKQIERDLAAAKRGEEGSQNTSTYSRMMGLEEFTAAGAAGVAVPGPAVPGPALPAGAAQPASEGESSDGEEETESEDDGEEGEEGEEGERRPRRRRVLHRDEDKDAKKERKAAAKVPAAASNSSRALLEEPPPGHLPHALRMPHVPHAPRMPHSPHAPRLPRPAGGAARGTQNEDSETREEESHQGQQEVSASVGLRGSVPHRLRVVVCDEPPLLSSVFYDRLN